MKPNVAYGSLCGSAMRISILLAFVMAACAPDLGSAPPHPTDTGPKPDSPAPQPQPQPQPQPVVDMGPDDTTCGGQQFALSRVPPNVLLVLDRSGSMADPIDLTSATSKWDDLKAAITSVIGTYDSQLQLGVSLFADQASGTCAPGKIDVAVGAMHGAQILTQVNASSPGSNTPTASTLDNVIQNGMLNDKTRDNVVVLATDGEPNCGDVDVTSRINTLYAQNPPVKTYVIGVGDATASDPSLLNAWAVAGHTAQTGAATQYYQANSPSDLKTAFDAIAGGLVSCTFKLGATPPDPTQLYVWQNGQPVAADPTNGFVYDPSGPSVILKGTTCDNLQKNPSTKIQVVYGCPSPPPIN
jgi:hypothetical protein